MINIKEQDLINSKNSEWLDITNNKSYVFNKNNIGFIKNSDESIEIKWSLMYKNEKTLLKITLNGNVYYYILESKENEYSIIATLKTKKGSKETKLIKKDKVEDIVKDVKLKENYSLKDLDNNDKLFLGFLFSIIFIFLLIIISITEILGSMSFIIKLMISIFASLGIIYYLKDIFIFTSKKYKNEIEEILNNINEKIKKIKK